jgi:Mg2+ and Co2+ transporter CorA
MTAVNETLDAHDKKFTDIEIREVGTEMRLAELREMQDELKNKQHSPEEDARFRDLQDLARSLEEEVTKMRDSLGKMNKDLISCRAAINTLRSHSEETASAVEDIRRIADGVREDTAATDKRLKKVVVFIQTETKEINTQIKDLLSSIERNANRIEEVATQRPSQAPAAAPEPKVAPPEPKPAEPPKIERTLPLPETTTIATSPHPVQSAPPEIQVITLPPQIVYEQPIVTVVKKQQVELETTGPKLPRLKPTPAQAMKGPPEVTKADLKKYDDLIARVDRCETMFVTVKTAIDALNKTAKFLTDTKADKDALQGVFDQFRLAVGELNNRVGALRKAVVQKADVSELQQLRNDLQGQLQAQGETAAGTEPVKCLLCGNPRQNVKGAIPIVADDTGLRTVGGGPGMSTRMAGADGGNSCFVYSETGEMFLGRSPDGKPIVLKNLLPQSSLPVKSDDVPSEEP